ncbi:MAG: serine/threonine-protein phosphatase [Lachnospiraceae bacterium]|nr:serine/threonine-protein phosphatase [Candidatus Colinaster scatohippi]
MAMFGMNKKKEADAIARFEQQFYETEFDAMYAASYGQVDIPYVAPNYDPFPAGKDGSTVILQNTVTLNGNGLSATNGQGAIYSGSLNYQVANLQGVGARARQEDSFTFANAFDQSKMQEEGLLFVVCDGMGGMRDGKVASEAAIASFRQSFAQMDMTGDISKQLRDSIFVASESVEEKLEGEGGSTAIVGIIYKEMLYFASVGDSFLFIKRGNNLYQINREHNMCNQIYLEDIEEGNLDPSHARNNREAVALTSFLGMVGISEVDGFKKPFKLREKDVILACSDGVGGVLSIDEMLNSLKMSGPEAMCHSLESGIVAHNKKNQDNYTALVINCTL